MFKMDLEKAEEPEIKLPTYVGSSKKQECSRKTSTSSLLTMPLTVWITTKCGKFLKDGNTRPPDLPPEKSVWGSSLAILLSQFGNQSVVPCPVVTVASWPSYRQRRQHIKKQRQHFANNGPSSQSYGFFSSHVWMWELNYKESWAQKNWCFWTVVLEKILESSLECKEIQPVNPKGNQSWIFIGKTNAEAETLTLWPPDVKNGLIGKDPDAGKDWRQEKKGMTEDEIVGWHH